MELRVPRRGRALGLAARDRGRAQADGRVDERAEAVPVERGPRVAAGRAVDVLAEVAGARDVLEAGGEVRVLAFRDGHSSSRIIDRLGGE